VQAPKMRGQLIGRISGLYQELGRDSDALSWLHRAGEVFEQAGDVQGLATYYGGLGQALRVQKRLTDEISAYRKMLTLSEGRSFHRTAAAARLSLAKALRFRKEYDEARRLLDEAEAICEQYHFREIIPAIGSCRGKIEKKLEAGQAPSRSLGELLQNLGTLLAYRPERSIAYLPFWYFATQSELLAALRSGPDVSFMVVTDNVESFLRAAGRLGTVADNFLMVTTVEPSVIIEPCILAIPPTWTFPLGFPLLLMKKSVKVAEATEVEEDDGADDVPVLPRIRFVGPAGPMPLYVPVESKSETKGEGHMMALKALSLPQQAIDLMIRQSITTLIERRTLWMASPRCTSRDPFLTDLRVAHERGFFPVYLDRFPASEATTVCAAARVTVPGRADGGHAVDAEKWRRALLRIAALPKDEAQSRMLDLPDIFGAGEENEDEVMQIEVVLFEFEEVGKRVVQPAILVKLPKPASCSPIVGSGGR
jgi:tetratricopeptide (TPR) repeat protein